ncbi:NmrA/HSCARG family protein [Duganella sp. BuS-21]|uniref:NmrA/HSCARG family protein n=1 Tax=Duganella sp. BuS-21 TaxID=2943848 RepID=UPI0035A6F5BE
MTNPHLKNSILVTGATGQQGGAVARHLLAGGFAVKALVRNPDSDKAKALAAKGIELVVGDLDDAASLVAAMSGVSGVYSVQNPRGVGTVVEVAQGKALVDAAKQAGVRQFVYSSVASADQSTGVPLFDSKFVIEQHLRASGVPFTIVRPVYFMDNWAWSEASFAKGVMAQPLSPDTHLQQICVDDIGAFVAATFADPATWLGQTAELAGDDLSMSDSAAAAGAARGLTVNYVQTPWDDYQKAMGQEYFLMLRWLEDTGYRADPALLRSVVPKARTLAAYLAR